jgi:hypothetical protein
MPAFSFFTGLGHTVLSQARAFQLLQKAIAIDTVDLIYVLLFPKPGLYKN